MTMSIRAAESLAQRQADASGIFRNFQQTVGDRGVVLDLERIQSTRRYTPYDQVQITVFDGSGVSAANVGINQHDLTQTEGAYFVPVGAQLVLEDQAIRFIVLEKSDEAASDVTVSVRVGRTPLTVDKVEQRRAGRSLRTV